MFNDMTDYDVDIVPGAVIDELQTFNEDCYEGKLKVETNMEKKWVKFSKEGDAPLLVKMKFFDLAQDEGEESDKKRLRLRFTKKRGDRMEWFELFKLMKETTFEEVLLAPKAH